MALTQTLAAFLDAGGAWLIPQSATFLAYRNAAVIAASLAGRTTALPADLPVSGAFATGKELPGADLRRLALGLAGPVDALLTHRGT